MKAAPHPSTLSWGRTSHVGTGERLVQSKLTDGKCSCYTNQALCRAWEAVCLGPVHSKKETTSGERREYRVWIFSGLLKWYEQDRELKGMFQRSLITHPSLALFKTPRFMLLSTGYPLSRGDKDSHHQFCHSYNEGEEFPLWQEGSFCLPDPQFTDTFKINVLNKCLSSLTMEVFIDRMWRIMQVANR